MIETELEALVPLFLFIIILFIQVNRLQDVRDAIDELSELADDDSDDTVHIVVQALKKGIHKF